MHSTFNRVARLTVIAGFSVGSLLGSPLVATADDQDPAVARISLLDGGVDVKRADSGDSFAAAVNAPLNAGDYLTTRDDARAELQLDDETELRVAPATQLRFTNLTATANVLQLAQGTVELRLFHGTDANPEVDTPNASIRPTGNGAYRISVDDNGNALLTVRAGSATVALANSSQDVTEGNSVAIDGDSQNAQMQSVQTIADDEFDAFNVARDSKEASSRSYAYVNDQVVGANDLDQYGAWQDTPDYGEVWHPRAASNWAPYRDGNWTWEPYYGWTWVSAEPWGWAPYHYGRWFYASDDGGWCWTPATQYVRPVYAPAQVAFFSFGLGNGGGISVGFGNVGWLPLGPRDAFEPWWGGNGYGGNGYGDGAYGRNTTITNITNVTNIYNYHNVNAPGGIVAVGSENFQHGDFRQRVNVTPAQLRLANIRPVRGLVPVLPTTRNLAFNPHEVARDADAPVSPRFRHFKPVAASFAPHPFAEQRAALSALAQRAYPSQAEAFEREAPAHAEARVQAVEPRAALPARENAPRTTAAPHGEPAYANPQRTTPHAQTGSPWDRFDSTGSATARSTSTLGSNRAAERAGTIDSERPGEARPSYALPDPARTHAHATGAEPLRPAAGAWDRFDSSPRTNANGGDAARPSYAKPQPAPDERRQTFAAPAPRTRRETEPSGPYAPVRGSYATIRHDAAPARAHEESRPVPVERVERYDTERNASAVRRAPLERAALEHPAVERAAPPERPAAVERSAPTERSRAGDGQSRAPTHPSPAERDHHIRTD